MWGAVSDERTGLSFTTAAGPRQRSRSWVRVPWDSWPHFTLSDLRLPFSSPPTTRRATVEVFDPASTRHLLLCSLSSLLHFWTLYLCWSDCLQDTFLKGSVSRFHGNSLPIYALSRECVYNCHPDNDAFTALTVAESLLSSRCIATDASVVFSDCALPAFRPRVTIYSLLSAHVCSKWWVVFPPVVLCCASCFQILASFIEHQCCK
jgi:hypothetical protein